VRVVVAPRAHAPLLMAAVSVRVFAETVPVMRAEPDMKASGAPERTLTAVPAAFVKVIARLALAAMVLAAPAELNPMTKFWHVLLWHDGMETDVTWYPEMGPLGAPELGPSKLVETVTPASSPAVCAPRVRPLIVTV